MAFKIFPIPNNLKIAKSVRQIEIKTPRLLFAKIKEKVKRLDKKNTKKKIGRTKIELGFKK